MKIRPLRNYIVVRRDNTEETSLGGIVLPGNVAEKPSVGEVIAVGPGKILDSGVHVPMDTSIGDRVTFGKHTGADVKIDDEDLLMMTEDEIIAIIE